MIYKMDGFIKEIKNEINSLYVKPMSIELNDLAIIKLVLVKLSYICSRDDRFFLYKEDISLRRKIYNKRLSFNSKNIKISCKSYCVFIQKILKKIGINTSLFSAGKDEFKHFGLIYESKNKKYYIDPLHDLVNLKICAKTQYFCCEYNKISNLTTLDDKKNQKINEIIKFNECYENFIKTISSLKIAGIGEIIEYILLNSNLISVSDSIIFLNKVIEDTFLSKYKEKIGISYCVTLKTINLHERQKIRKRSNNMCIKYLDKTFYYFPSIKLMIKNIVKDIYTKPKYDINMYRYLRDKHGNRQILDNIYFQKLFCELEREFNLSEEDISISSGDIFINKLDIKFSIYKHKYLFLETNNKSFYYKIKCFGLKVYKKNIKKAEFKKQFKYFKR